MPDGFNLPDLTFPSVVYGTKETPWDLNVLLYLGGAATNRRTVAGLIAGDQLGDPQVSRLPVVTKLHHEVKEALDCGGSRETALTLIVHLRLFFGWADRTGMPLGLAEVVDSYREWAESLVRRTRLKADVASNRAPDNRPLTMSSAYIYGANVAMLLDRVLGRHSNLIELTRLSMPSHRKTAMGLQAEKQNLEHTFAFGHLLQDVCDQLTVEIVRESPLPIRIPLRNGKVLIRGGGTMTGSLTASSSALGDRYSVVNLRIESELMMFIGQTGMNLVQAQNLELRHFFYVSHLDGFQVKDHKARRGGIVLFEIFSEYRPHFERYLAWRRDFFPHSRRLFPFIRVGGTREDLRSGAHRLRAICSELKMPFVGPQALRSTRVNWLLRQTANPDLTAEMAQHTKETLLGVYERPSQQLTMVEVTRFWARWDRRLTRTDALAPGGCTGNPGAVQQAPKSAPSPDCRKPSGCLWCEDHRDIDSQDHVWALVSFKHLKLIEISKTGKTQEDHDDSPARHAVNRLNEKLRWFTQSSELRRAWVEEAEARILEGSYHPSWEHIITEQEGGQ